jgi:hypothetical protein
VVWTNYGMQQMRRGSGTGGLLPLLEHPTERTYDRTLV